MGKHFSPKRFGSNPRSMFPGGQGTMSMAYWDWAEELRDAARGEIEGEGYQYSKNVFLAVVMYCASVEAYINESLAVLEGRTTRSVGDDRINELKRQGRIKDKLESTFNMFASEIAPGKLNRNAKANFFALCDLRNAILHYSLDWNADTLDWPKRLQDALQRSKAGPIEADWTITFRTLPVVDWAAETTQAILQDFLKVTRGDEKEFFNLQVRKDELK